MFNEIHAYCIVVISKVHQFKYNKTMCSMLSNKAQLLSGDRI